MSVGLSFLSKTLRDLNSQLFSKLICANVLLYHAPYVPAIRSMRTGACRAPGRHGLHLPALPPPLQTLFGTLCRRRQGHPHQCLDQTGTPQPGHPLTALPTAVSCHVGVWWCDFSVVRSAAVKPVHLLGRGKAVAGGWHAWGVTRSQNILIQRLASPFADCRHPLPRLLEAPRSCPCRFLKCCS